MKKLVLSIVILIMAVGFASISTNLIIKGNTKINENKEDFEIYFSDAKLDNKDVYDEIISEDKKTITFTSKDLKKLNDTSILNYEVTNNSRNYDAEVKINCNVKDNTRAEYTSITNVLNAKDNIVHAKEIVDGNVTITLNKVSTIELTEEYTCTLEFNAVERTVLGYSIVKLYDYIESNADKNATIDFSVNSKTSGTNGIYTTKNTNSGKEVYYYRGKVDNNIIYNNMCWKIIRTTETGGVKLIYNGIPDNGKCSNTGDNSQLGELAFNTNWNDNAYVGYMYGSTGATTYKATHANTNSSTIKTYIDNWFSSNFDESVQNMLEDTVFCNNRNTKAYDSALIVGSTFSSYGDLGYGKNATLYEVASRAWWYTITPNPTLVCKNTNGFVPENNDSFTVSEELGNGALTYPVGLITSDEAIYAGFNTCSDNSDDCKYTNSFLYNGKWYWTSSPIGAHSNGYSFVGALITAGIASSDGVNMSGGVRPVVSLKNGVKISLSQDGSEDKPYIIVN